MGACLNRQQHQDATAARAAISTKNGAAKLICHAASKPVPAVSRNAANQAATAAFLPHAALLVARGTDLAADLEQRAGEVARCRQCEQSRLRRGISWQPVECRQVQR